MSPTADPAHWANFFAELKRRRVVRVAVVYGAVAFAVLQAADILVPALGLPAWVVTLVVVLLLLGLPLALALAWAFDFTPEGVQRTVTAGDIAPDVPQRTERWLSVRTVMLAAVVLILGAAARVRRDLRFAPLRGDPRFEELVRPQ